MPDAAYPRGMVGGMRTVYPSDSNIGLSSEFPEGYRLRQKVLEEGRRILRPKSCDYSYQDDYHPHLVVPPAQIFLTLSLATPSYRPSLHPVSSLLYVGSSWSPCFCSAMWGGPSLMSSSLLLQQCPACLVRLTLIVFAMGDMWPYSCCFASRTCSKLLAAFVVCNVKWIIGKNLIQHKSLGMWTSHTTTI